MKRTTAILCAALLFCSCARKESERFVPKDWTPFDLMEYLSYEKAAECFPTDYYLMSDGMFIRCVTDTGRIMLWCETDEEHRIKTIKQMSGNTPPPLRKILNISTLEALEGIKELAECGIAALSASEVFIPTDDYRRIYIEIEAQIGAKIIKREDIGSYAELADALTVRLGWYVDKVYLSHNFLRYQKSGKLRKDIERRVAQLRKSQPGGAGFFPL